ncbi:MAG: 23S rRNA (guanosine(2251)-2'-O)-methyltransferase RlmB [Deltaproteobacteria bacterium]|nr:23S rRNA (guanosine(2251)-2'-O)-methyltransferase RlmB [Candidatus Anaeroferrophillus wilburensis]MBN2888192.1 23S rRNA (guanosine(2251)-2'-O)-methyltransferase RlmB [Deltaproteobacteria bacterium]
MSKPQHPDAETEIIFGINAVNELLQSGNRDVEVFYCEESAGKRIKVLESLARRQGLLIKHLPKAALSRLAGVDRHQGVAVSVAQFNYSPLAALLPSAAVQRHPLPAILALDGVTDPQNLGAILRTAAAAGVAGVIIPERRAAGITPVVARIASGGLEYVKICRVTNLVTALQQCREQGYWIAGTVTAAEGLSVYQADLCRPLVIVVGSEAKGMRPLVRRTCDLLLTIPLRTSIESLNVSAATAVVLFEMLRQQEMAAVGR